MTKIKAYTELVSVIEKYTEDFKEDYYVSNIIETLKRLKMQERFGITLEGSGDYYSIPGACNNFTRVALYGEDHNRTISWPDEGEQPKNEWLYCISFPAGPYIFGDYFKNEYPKETFKAFWDELKTFNPKYCDTVNSCMYFTAGCSKQVHESLLDTYMKYKALVADEIKLHRKKELEKELAELSKETSCKHQKSVSLN